MLAKQGIAHTASQRHIRLDRAILGAHSLSKKAGATVPTLLLLSTILHVVCVGRPLAIYELAGSPFSLRSSSTASVCASLPKSSNPKSTMSL